MAKGLTLHWHENMNCKLDMNRRDSDRPESTVQRLLAGDSASVETPAQRRYSPLHHRPLQINTIDNH